MSAFRAVRRSGLWRRPNDGYAPRSGRSRWAARAIGGALTAGACWDIYVAVLAIIYRDALTVRAKRGDLVLSVGGDGTIESGKTLDFKCRVRGSFSILQMVPDGGFARAGDVLVQLDSTPLEEAIAAEEVVLARIKAAAAAAKKTQAAAQIAIDEYREGTYVEQRLGFEREILVAQRRLASAERVLLESQIMHRRGFTTRLRVEALEFAVERAQTDLAAAKLKKDVLDDFTRAKMLGELTSRRDAAAAQLKSHELAVWRQTAKLKRLESDLGHCAIRAPWDGMALHPGGTVRGRDGSSQPAPALYPGARVRQFQPLVRLADISHLQVKLLVPETKLGLLRRGQRADLRVIDQELQGEVESIADRPQEATLPGDNGRQYAVILRIIGDARLRPGLTAEVEIVVKRKSNVLSIPSLCVTDEQGKPRVRVKKLSGWEPRLVMLGDANDSFVEVVDGVKEGECVLLNPMNPR